MQSMCNHILGAEALKENLKREARRMGITLNAIVLQILWEWVENRKQEEGKAGAAEGRATL